MAYLYGENYTRSQLLARVGDISQIARIKPYRLVEGLEDGLFALDVCNGSGLEFTVLASRGMDISTARFNGRSLAWRSATSDTHPAYFDHEGEQGRGWLRSFYGGLVVTCGMTWAGANDIENGRQYGLHGRVSNLPATGVQWDGTWQDDEYLLTIRGKVREATVFGENIQLTRTITTRMGETRLFIQDHVENMGARRTEHMILYHINVGFPVVNDSARLISPTLAAQPRDPDAEDGKEFFATMHAPVAGYREKVYFHEFARLEDGRVGAAMVNPDCHIGTGTVRGLGVYCCYYPEQLPRFIEWKMLDAGTYVVGMEPANCLVLGRPKEREAGTLQFLEPGEIREYTLEIGLLVGQDQIDAFENACHAAIHRARS
ncbi:MAG: aldose 1-epimerase family protein [Chloroherpetonaceae bacterium]|nr:aldose 1-epimerase family protein [Chthonomonadaceae bacterium]MDW8208752.1 aldose 1-epimerase family protein [Chloroherpetonaceae bacterium]